MLGKLAQHEVRLNLACVGDDGRGRLVAARFDPENDHLRLKRCRHGTMLYIHSDKYIGRSLDLYGEFSEAESKVLNQILKPGMVAVDAGANIGCHTISMAQSVAPKGAVFAIEAQRVLQQILCANVAINGIENVVTRHAALGDHEGRLFVPRIDYQKGGNYGGVSMVGHERGEPTPLITIDSLDLPACHLLKIDVEGMEIDVLKGAVETIAAHQPTLYVENDRRENAPVLIQWLLDRDYRLYWHRPALFNPDNYFGVEENVFGRLISRNMFCLPKDSVIAVTNFDEITSADIDF